MTGEQASLLANAATRRPSQYREPSRPGFFESRDDVLKFQGEDKFAVNLDWILQRLLMVTQINRQ